MKPPIRLAILECDTPLPNTKAVYGSYGGRFDALLTAAAKTLDPDVASATCSLQVSKWQIELHPDTYPEPKDIDAVLITGSRHNAFEDTPWIKTLVSYVASLLNDQTRVRVIGVCFGHQIVGRALGVKIGRNPDGWEASVLDVALTPKGKEIFGGKGSLSLQFMHRDIVFTQPPGTQPLGSNAVCQVQGMYTPRRLLTIQGHPEFDRDIMTEILEMRHKAGIFDDETFADAMARVAKRHDGLVVARAFLDFLSDDNDD